MRVRVRVWRKYRHFKFYSFSIFAFAILFSFSRQVLQALAEQKPHIPYRNSGFTAFSSSQALIFPKGGFLPPPFSFSFSLILFFPIPFFFQASPNIFKTRLEAIAKHLSLELYRQLLGLWRRRCPRWKWLRRLDKYQLIQRANYRELDVNVCNDWFK